MLEIILNQKIIFGIISVIFTFISYYFYIKDIFYGENRPHLYSWLVWGIITMLIYFIQIGYNSGPGSWIVLLSGIMSFIIFFISIYKGTKDITISDTISLMLAFISIGLWILLDNPIYLLILLISIDIFGYYPTFRKSFKNPFQENYILYLLSIFKFGIAIFALNEITLETSLYLIANFIITFFIVVMIVFRRRYFNQNK